MIKSKDKIKKQLLRELDSLRNEKYGFIEAVTAPALADKFIVAKSA